MKKLKLNKKTIASLPPEKLSEIKAGEDKDPCWENLWSLYHCDVIYTCSRPA